MNLLLDTNILIYLARDYTLQLLNKIKSDKDRLFISVVTVGELKSLAIQNNWGERKLALLDVLLEDVIAIEVNENLIDTYAQIDTYSQCRNPSFDSYPHSTPRNMGKNDLWIAATSALLNLTLVTSDNDFNHLHQVFFDVQKFQPSIAK